MVVPTLNEASSLGPSLDRLAVDGFDELVVADGGSTDGAREIVQVRPGVRWIEAPRGRGIQLQAGVRACRAELVLLLHADTEPPLGAAAAVRAALADPGVSGGAFRARFDRRSLVLDLFSWVSRFESGWTTFGDQGLFFRRADFERVGGLPPWPFLEDVELRRRLKRLGAFVKRPEVVTTSARRYLAEGPIRRQLLNVAVLLMYRAGVSPHRLARWYRARTRVAPAEATAVARASRPSVPLG